MVEAAGVASETTTPDAGPQRSYEGTVTQGSSQNDFYAFLSAHESQTVRVDVVMTAGKVDNPGVPRSLEMATGCDGATPPANCGWVLDALAVRYVFAAISTETDASLIPVGGGVRVRGTFAVRPVTRTSAGTLIVLLRPLNASSYAPR